MTHSSSRTCLLLCKQAAAAAAGGNLGHRQQHAVKCTAHVFCGSTSIPNYVDEGHSSTRSGFPDSQTLWGFQMLDLNVRHKWHSIASDVGIMSKILPPSLRHRPWEFAKNHKTDRTYFLWHACLMGFSKWNHRIFYRNICATMLLVHL